jgi:(R)-3-[(carboxymethyl)amino]fatty acid dioxygenase/decarboxylase
MKTTPLAIGCSVEGIDAGKITKPQLKKLRDLLYRNRLVVLKNQNLDESAYCEFSKRFGEPVPYLQENYHHPDFPLIFVSSNVKKDGKQIGVARTGGYWHSDTSFEADPKFITMLMPKVLPSVTRSTRFIDMAAVYAALPQATKDRLEGAQFLHSGRMRFKIRPDCIGYDIFEILEMINKATPPNEHPGVITHPYTKEKVIYGSRGFVVGIKDRSLDEQAALLGEIFDLAETDRFIREVEWSMGDVIIWDNRFLQHSSARNPGPEEPTMMYRITLKDGMPLCASQTVPAETAA